jgi:serine protease Do
VEAVSDGPAAKAGIQAGDVILAVNGGSVTNGDELRERVSKAGNKLALLILRGDRKMYVPIKVG